MTIRRRDFLHRLGAAGMAATLPWHRIERTPKLGAIGIQLYTVRRDLARDVEGTLAKIAEIGYQEVEFAGYPDGTAASLRAILDRLRLTAPSGHVPFQSIRSAWEQTLDQAAMLGQRYVVVAWVPAEERQTVDGWKRVAALFNKAGEEAKKRKIQFAYHNHDFEFVPIDGTIPYELLHAGVDSGLVQFELDLYWMIKAGHDPLRWFTSRPGRFPLLHVKDMDATARKFFADIGTGTIDFARVFRRAGQGGVRHYFYEQDSTPGSPFDSAKVAYEFLRKLTW
ncbi:MAG: sugar phosphate isomerase/epimerase [Gemmatimonadales bacterium]|nr:sugar phosphate isomerase/epimerase [Gemmatimonadales bacterium]